MSQKYNFYATLLDKYQDYLSSSVIYNQNFGFSENAEKTEEEFEKEKFNELIDCINRVPFDSELADKGTAFNEVIDCMIEGRKSDKMEISKGYDSVTNNLTCLIANYKDRVFTFPLSLCRTVSEYLKGAIVQQLVESKIKTKYGEVLLYGYIDGILPFKIYDIKTTSKYTAFKYRNKWQHIVYPFCLINSGVDIADFEYLVTDFKNVFFETYTYSHDSHHQDLVLHCEGLIEFLEQNKDLITDKKIFNFRL
jgi:hypothetical protein